MAQIGILKSDIAFYGFVGWNFFLEYFQLLKEAIFFVAIKFITKTPRDFLNSVYKEIRF